MRRKKTKQDNHIIFSVTAIAIVILIALFFLGKPKKTIPIKIIKKPHPIIKIVAKPKIAFVLDDWGYSLRNEKYITDKDLIFTLAILPNLKYSTKIAELAKSNKKEVMLHLPMQPKDKSPDKLEKLTINPAMNAKIIREIISSDLKNVPHAKGVNNHMGSLATEDAELIKNVFLELKKRGLYFVDSRTAKNSVCPGLAKKMKIKFVERSVFLDNKNELNYIKSQIMQLMQAAKAKKTAVGIGHDRPKTMQAIKEMMPEIKKQGIQVVFVSEIFKK